MNVILVEDDVAPPELGTEKGDELEKTDPATLDSAEVKLEVKVSLNSVAGLTSPRTMKIRGVIMNQPVVTLIDPGATHNFIS